jgi:hypothetical protein
MLDFLKMNDNLLQSVALRMCKLTQKVWILQTSLSPNLELDCSAL